MHKAPYPGNPPIITVSFTNILMNYILQVNHGF